MSTPLGLCGPTDLIAALPEGCVITDPARMANYRWDRANDPNAGVPLAVVRTGCTGDIQKAVRFAAERGIAVVPRGAGTGVSGGSSALDACIVVSTERMRDIHVDPVTRTVTVQPSVLNAEVKQLQLKMVCGTRPILRLSRFARSAVMSPPTLEACAA